MFRLKSAAALFAALLVGLAFIGSATTASAHYHHRHNCCGPVHPSYEYRTTNVIHHVTRYHDRSVTNYVRRIHRIVHITRIRPIIYVHTVTRIHHHTVGIIRSVHEHVTQYLPAERIMSHSSISTYDCVCSGRRRHCR